MEEKLKNLMTLALSQSVATDMNNIMFTLTGKKVSGCLCSAGNRQRVKASVRVYLESLKA